MIRDPALRFWVDSVEAEGGLCEHDTETAELILPPALQRAFGLPEALTVTSDPDIAQDDGVTLVAVGHPALDAAVTRVLAQGDVGRSYLTWPHSPLPSRAALLARARTEIGIDHGRVDDTRDPVPVYYGLLRVGALVTYVLDDRFQEREEVWMDACVPHALPAAVVRAVQSQPTLPEPERAAPTVMGELATTVAAAHAALDRRAASRAAALERAAQVGMSDELARAQGYYDAVLATLEQRRAAASTERRRLLDAQAEATRLERTRRLREIAAKFEASRAIAPYRLNLVLAPALAFPVDVRRGERRYPLPLYWLISAACFAALSCPACGANETLVAGRSRLGCRRCSH